MLWHGLGLSPLEARSFIDNDRNWKVLHSISLLTILAARVHCINTCPSHPSCCEQAVEQFYHQLVSGDASLSEIGVTELLDREVWHSVPNMPTLVSHLCCRGLAVQAATSFRVSVI